MTEANSAQRQVTGLNEYEAKWIRGNETETLRLMSEYTIAMNVFINSYTWYSHKTTSILPIPEPDDTITLAQAQGRNLHIQENPEDRVYTFTYIITHYGLDSLLKALDGRGVTAHADKGTLYMDWTGHYLFDRNYKKEK